MIDKSFDSRYGGIAGQLWSAKAIKTVKLRSTNTAGASWRLPIVKYARDMSWKQLWSTESTVMNYETNELVPAPQDYIWKDGKSGRGRVTKDINIPLFCFSGIFFRAALSCSTCSINSSYNGTTSQDLTCVDLSRLSASRRFLIDDSLSRIGSSSGCRGALIKGHSGIVWGRVMFLGIRGCLCFNLF